MSEIRKYGVQSQKKIKKIPTKKELEHQYAHDHEIVEGKFTYNDIPGGKCTFYYRKWKQDPIEEFTLEDGNIYRIPRCVAVHLNEDCWYPVHENMITPDGTPSKRIGRKVKYCSFNSLEFNTKNDFKEVNDQILTVENEIIK